MSSTDGCNGTHKTKMAEAVDEGTKKCILVTGGAGYIGSHTVIEVLSAGYSAIIVDNLCNSSMESVRRLEEISGQKIPFYKIDLVDTERLRDVFRKHKFTAVMHFAGLKAVGESCTKPLMYYQNNIGCTVSLLEVMTEFGVNDIIFSSSATVYGVPQFLPLTEAHPAGQCTNPYGKTKFFIEQILEDISAAQPSWNIVLLRYFNPVGAHKCGRIGEDPQGAPNNLMPFVAQVAVGRRPTLSVYGDDYATPDGTGVRDYIHVVDLALGHVAALRALEAKCRCKIYNLGTGVGYSVLEMVKAFEAASGKKVAYEIVGRRTGDVGSVYADPSLSLKELGWKAEKGLQEMCEDLWRWQSTNPTGFRSE